jgi:hypothetical protein
MNQIVRGMYLRPGNLWKDYHVLRKETRNTNGYKVDGKWIDTGELIKGVLAEASTADSERTKHMWDQDQHSLTHTMAVRGRADVLKGYMLSNGEKGYLVLVNDNVGALGMAGLLYLEERNDLK